MTLARAGVAIALGLGLAHVVARYAPAPRLAGVLKPLPIVLLAAIVASAPSPAGGAYRWLVVAALLCSTVGDVCLLSGRRFVAGLASFLVAHLLYIAAFAPAAGATGQAWVLVVPFIVTAGAVLAYLWPHLGASRGPVAAYVAVLVAMGWQAAARAGAATVPPASGLLALVGAVLFMTSDGILAVDRFAHRVRLADAAVMTSYYAAQTLIACSAIV